MTEPQPGSPESDAQPVEPWLARLLGFVLLAFGVLLLGLLAWGTYRVQAKPGPVGSEVLTLAAGMLIIGLFCSMVGGRLFLAVPNRFGSVLSPFGWYTLGLLSLVGGVALGIAGLRAGRFSELVGTAFFFIFAFWCLRAAKRLRGK